ncbi:hypothetical protein ASG53_18100 [Sanguibacter sp. Leaf3]|nr:hypothetical protein ASG53_18100 [Sanguibacter sp. Leaf3]
MTEPVDGSVTEDQGSSQAPARRQEGPHRTVRPLLSSALASHARSRTGTEHVRQPSRQTPDA